MISQSGKTTSIFYITGILVLVFILIIIICQTIYSGQPYVLLFDFNYNSNYNKKFVLPEGYDVETQGRKWANWDTDEKGIAKICHLFNESMGYFQNSKKKEAEEGMKLLGEWIVAYLTELEDSPVVYPTFQGFPWGSNGYEFTYESTKTLAYYIVNKHNTAGIVLSAAKAIQYIIISPTKSLGYDIDGANSAMLLMPWTLSHLITGTLNKNDPGYLYAVEQYNFAPTVEDLTADGVHLDYSYLTHKGVYAYGDLDLVFEVFSDAVQIVPEIRKYKMDEHIDIIDSIFKHPTVPLSGGTFYHRREDIKMDLYKGKRITDEVEIIPSIPYMRFFTDKFQWCAKGFTQYPNVAWYESDQEVSNMGQYAQFCRHVFKKGDPYTTEKPLTGFIWKEGIDWKQTVQHTATTPQLHFLMYDSDAHVHLFKTDTLIYYEATGIIIPFLNETISINETIMIDPKARKIQCKVELLDHRSPHNIQIGDKAYPLDSSNTWIFYTIDMETGKYIVNGSEIEEDGNQWSKDSFQDFTTEYFQDSTDPIRYVAKISGKPKILSPGNILNNEVETGIVSDTEHSFKYDSKSRQILVID